MNEPKQDSPTSSHTWHLYQSAWQDLSDDERAQRLEASMTKDSTYRDPVYEAHAYDELAAIISMFVTTTPGATFTNYQFLKHHRQANANWRLELPGAPRSMGSSHATFAVDGG